MGRIEEGRAGRSGASRLGLFSWCVYDWANSAFPTVIITFVFSAYFTSAVAESPTVGTAQWGRALSSAAFIVAIASPVLGAIADRAGRRKPWLAGFTALCVTASALLWFTEPQPGFVAWALVLVAVASVAFDFATVFYNAMLPAIARHDYLGRMSGWGWAAGYAGGLACLIVALVGFARTEAPWLPLDAESAEPVRATVLLVAAWYAVFSLPLFLFTPDTRPTGLPLATAAREGVRTLIATFRRARQYASVGRYLLAHMIYADGLNTLFAFGGVFAAGTFGMSVEEVILFGITMNVTAGLGAAAFAWVDDWIGSWRTITIALVSLLVLGAALLLLEGKEWFWAIGLCLGVFVGPVQAASRSFMARLAPPEIRTEMFGLYALSGKATAFLGPLLVGWATLWFDSQRAGMAAILAFFALGLVLLWPLRRVRV